MDRCAECQLPNPDLIDAVDVWLCPRCEYATPKETEHLLAARREAAVVLGVTAS